MKTHDFLLGRFCRHLLVGCVLGVFSVVGFSSRMALAQHYPQMPLPNGVPLTAERVELGRKLFFDPRLSRPERNQQTGLLEHKIACATCHDPYQGYSDGRPQAVGIRGQIGQFNTPTILNPFGRFMFWDGRTDGMPTQSLQPLVNPIEMGNGSEQEVLNRLRRIPGYVDLFNRAYGFRNNTNQAITRERFGHAMASFQSTIISSNAPVDRRMAGDLQALSPQAEKGYGLFVKLNCMACHKYPSFTDFAFHNNGMEFAGKFRPTSDGLFTTINGRAGFSAADRQRSVRAFKTPTLREIARTGPYNHAGTFSTLRRVLEHYNAGGAKLNEFGQVVADANRDPRIKPLHLTDAQLDALETFLVEGMAGKNYPKVIAPVLP